MSAECIFCKIIAKQIPSSIIAENDDVIVIQDIHPKAPVHYLIIPKKHVADVASLQQDELKIGQALFAMAQQLGNSLKTDFRLIINNGSGMGQSVFHLHMHFLAGKKMADF